MSNEKRIPQSTETELKSHFTIREMPPDERPYEKCEKFGPGTLSDAELLAVVIRSGTNRDRAIDLAYRVLKLRDDHSGLNCLFHLSINDLTGINGIGRIKAIQLLCAAELARRMNYQETAEKISFSDSAQVAAFFAGRLCELEHEEVHAAYLDVKSRLIVSECVFIGSLSHSVIEPREIFSKALKFNAASIILAHNHPSGLPRPSEQDISATIRLRDCGNILGIRVIDHIIVATGGYASMRDAGVL